MNHRATETPSDPFTRKVIGLAIEVHRHLGPGLLESAYEECLCWGPGQTDLSDQRQIGHPEVCFDFSVSLCLCGEYI